MKTIGEIHNGKWSGAIWLAALAVAGCGINQPLGSQIPPVVHSQVASFDGAEQNSGILGEAGGQFHVTPHFHGRYLAMAAIFGQQFTPPLDVARGVTAAPDGSYFFDPQAMSDFLRMNRWRRQAPPVTPGPSLLQKIL